MVQVQSTWFPLYDRNPRPLCRTSYAQPADYKPPSNHIYAGSHIELPEPSAGFAITKKSPKGQGPGSGN